MRFRNYCLVVIGNTIGVINEIVKISETTPNYLDGKGLFISSFSSALNISELTDWFTNNNRNFLIFELNPNTSGYNFIKPETTDGLFGFLKTINLEDKSSDLLREILHSANTKTNRFNKPIKDIEVEETLLTEKDVDKMSKFEREEHTNKLIDKGVANLTENDKKMLEYIAKKG